MMAPGKGLSCTQTGIRAFNPLCSFPEASSLSWKGNRGQGFLPQWPGNLRNGEEFSIWGPSLSPLLLNAVKIQLLFCWTWHVFSFFFFKIFFWLGCTRSWLWQVGSSVFMVACGIFSWGMWDLVPWPGMELEPSALGARSLSHWKVPVFSLLKEKRSKTFTSFLRKNVHWVFGPNYERRASPVSFMDECYL